MGLFEKVRLKTPRHPNETLEHFYARLVAFTHAYGPGLMFSRGLFEPEEPTIWAKDELGNITRWIEVGDVDIKKLSSVLKNAQRCRRQIDMAVYFFGASEISRFYRELRSVGLKEPYKVKLFTIESDELQPFITSEQSSSNWLVTILDDTLYIVCNGNQLSLRVKPVEGVP